MLDIDPSLMLFMLIDILVLIFALNKVLFSPLVSFMDQRENSIKSELEASKNIGLDSDDLRAKAEQILESARQEAHLIKQEAVDKAKKLSEEKIADKQNILNREYKVFSANLTEENNALRLSLLAQMPQLKESIQTKLSKL